MQINIQVATITKSKSLNKSLIKKIERHVTLNKIPLRAVNWASVAGNDFSSHSSIGKYLVNVLLFLVDCSSCLFAIVVAVVSCPKDVK